MKKFRNLLVFGAMSVALFIGLSFAKNAIAGKSNQLSREEIVVLLAEHNEVMGMKLNAQEMTEEEVVTNVEDYWKLLGVCDNEGSPVHDGSKKGQTQFADLTEEKVLELIELKKYYLDNLVSEGLITVEEAEARLLRYSNMLYSRLDGTFVNGSGNKSGHGNGNGKGNGNGGGGQGHGNGNCGK